jgi:hypothetical protein
MRAMSAETSYVPDCGQDLTSPVSDAVYLAGGKLFAKTPTTLLALEPNLST